MKNFSFFDILETMGLVRTLNKGFKSENTFQITT